MNREVRNQMKKLLLITGDLATGKSTFSDILSKRYDTVAFTKDTIKEVLGDTIEKDLSNGKSFGKKQ